MLLTRIFYYPGKVFRKLLNFYLWRTEKLRNFLFPNLYAINEKKISADATVRYPQRLIFIGPGLLTIGANTVLGNINGGRHYGGRIEIQARSAEAKINIGKKVWANNNLFIGAHNSVVIGDNCMIGSTVTIMDFEAHHIDPNRRRELGVVGSVEIGNNVWIGNNVTVLKNTKIGANSIIAAGAVVSGEFPDNVILAGIPAKVIKAI